MWNECNCAVVWTFFDIAFPWDWNENWAFPVLWPLLSFPNLLAYCLWWFFFLRPPSLRTPGYLALGEWSHHCDYLGREDLFRTVLLCIPATSSWYLLLLLGLYHSVLQWAHLCMKCFLDISNFLEETFSLPISLFSLFLCIDPWGRLSYLSLLFSGTLHSGRYSFSFPLCFGFSFHSYL